MKKSILVTGGAGFIGSFLVDQLIEEGHSVRILDNLDQQVHQGKKPDYLNPKAEFMLGDVTKKDDFEKALQDQEAVFHLAAAVGVGQSMYQVSHYITSCAVGTANLMDLLVNKEHDVKKVVVAASMSSYGEGAYACEKCGISPIYPDLRPEAQLAKGQWEHICPDCGGELKPIPTPETKHQECNSIYAIAKKIQEDVVLNIGKTYGIPSTALRFFNVFGPRQSLNNPYTGVVAIFTSRIKNMNSPTIYEDGLQTRDFISVHDIARANILSMEKSSANYERFNVGTGNPISIKGIAENIAESLGLDVKPEVTGKFRKGDIRHCYADISKIKSKLDFTLEVSFEKQMAELVEWGKKVEAEDKFEQARKELEEKGLA